MDEQQKKIYTIIGCIVMLGSLFYGMQFLANNSGQAALTGSTLSGTTEFNATIRTYEPILIVPSMPDSLVSALRSDDRVKAITGGASGYLINVSTRDDVFSLAQDLQAQNVSSSAMADIILPVQLDVRYGNATDEMVNASGSIGIWTEPFVDVGSDVTVQMTAVTQDGTLVSYSSPTLVTNEVSVTANATVVSLTGKEYAFIIPWENRSSVDEASLSALYGNGSVTYSRNDFITFQPPLNVSQINATRSLPYITYISDTGASVSANFTDINRTVSDFNGTAVVFPDSELDIVTNQSVGLPYPGNVSYGYVISLPSGADGYSMNSQPVALALPGRYSVNDTVSVLINGTAMGGAIVQINGIGPD
jgi:hypothetical protein